MRQAIQRLKDEEIAKRALNIVKYQNFRTKVALTKMDVSVPRVVFESGVTYLKRGKKDPALSQKLKTEIDKCVSKCVQPLKPSHDEQRRFIKAPYQTKEAKPPVCNLPILKQKVSSVFDYGVKIGNCVKMFDNKKEALAFLDGARFANSNVEAVLVEVELRVVRGE